MIIRKSASIFLFLTIYTMTGCGSDGDDPTPPPVNNQPTLAELRTDVLEKIGATWTSSSVTRESINVQDDFANFSLTIGEGTYSSQNGKHVWPASGSWSWVDDKTDQILRDDNVVIDLTVETDKLTLSFDIDEDVFGIGRTQTTTSSFVFVLVN